MFKISFLAIDPAWISPDQVFGLYIFNHWWYCQHFKFFWNAICKSCRIKRYRNMFAVNINGSFENLCWELTRGR